MLLTWFPLTTTQIFIYFYIKLYRFIRLPIIERASSTSPSGPASVTFYHVPVSKRHLPDLNYPARFRSELSMAFSRAYLLKPHAVVLSYLENRPLASYVDRAEYDLADLYYTHPQSPATDMANTLTKVAECHRMFRHSGPPNARGDVSTRKWYG